MVNVVERLNIAKKQKGITLKQLAEASGLSLGTVNKIMSGELKKIKADKLSNLARALDVDVEWLQDDSVQRQTDYLGMVKVACISPEVKVADCAFNTEKIVEGLFRASNNGVKIALLPELCITGYSCGDLFFQSALRNAAIDGLQTICRKTKSLPLISIVGLPICCDGRLYNAAAVVYRGEVLGVIPKKNLPNYNEFVEKRHFCAYEGENTTIRLFGRDVPFGIKLLFANTLHDEVRFAVELCEDVWVAESPSIWHAKAGANAVFNLSASNETIVKCDYRKKMIELQSAKSNIAYVYCSCGASESTGQTVFSAHNIICENGECIAETPPFTSDYVDAAIDFDFLENERARMEHTAPPDGYTVVRFEQQLGSDVRVYDASPFVPQQTAQRQMICERAFAILAFGLKKRVEHIQAKKLVIGVSGGSDSTLSLLVCAYALRIAKRSPKDIVAVTMPCFGTSKRTLSNSVALCKALGVDLRTIDISSSVEQHLRDIGHDMTPDTTFENAQARERTQVLMDIANAEGGLVVGTGDMSEAALGWSTFNGDQMSMYAAIASVPKTLVKAMLIFCAEHAKSEMKSVLRNIVDTPVSPELLPADKKGNITQITEEVIGPYELHDYFLFMLVRKGFTPKKIYQLAKLSFAQRYDAETIKTWLKFFLKRFFSQQYKRNCTPDSVRLGSVDISKYGYRMPADATAAAWLAELDSVQ